MLIRFGVKNHRSILDYQELLLTASRRIPRAAGLTFPAPAVHEGAEAVPAVAVYGANASGKSNLLDAIRWMRDSILLSHQQLNVDDAIPRRPFLLDDEKKALPTGFDCTFTLPATGKSASRSDSDVAYEYGFEFNDQEFIREWLYQTVLRKRRSTQVLFERQAKGGKPRFSFGNDLHGENEVIGKLTRPNSLFLSAAAQNNHPQLTTLFRYFRECWSVNFPSEHPDPVREQILARQLSVSKNLDSVKDLLTQADVGLVGVNVISRELPPEVAEIMKEFSHAVEKHLPDYHIETPATEDERLQFLHFRSKGDPVPLGYGAESRGTRTLLSLLLPICKALSTGAVVVVDEIDTSLHPRLQEALISLFKEKESNPYGAQIIFSTHDMTLLKGRLLRRDEVWFANKDSRGVSTLKPLTTFRLRSRDDIEKAYRQGRLGGIPTTDRFDYELEEAEVG